MTRSSSTTSPLRRRYVGLVMLPFVAASLVGCSQIQTAVSDSAKDVASGAATAATSELTEQICAPIADGSVSAEDQQTISQLLSLAESTGLGTDLINSMEAIAGEGTEISASDVDSFIAACNSATPAT